jgi:hypothetical protein
VSAPIHIEVEDQLRFTFQRPAWNAVKWDEDPAYLRGLRRHDGKAVDIVSTLDRRSLRLFEIKDPRGHWIEYRDQNPVEVLAEIVADKVRDTLAGLHWMKPKVLVTSRALWPGMPGLTVESMHGAPWSG